MLLISDSYAVVIRQIIKLLNPKSELEMSEAGQQGRKGGGAPQVLGYKPGLTGRQGGISGPTAAWQGMCVYHSMYGSVNTVRPGT